VLLVAPIHACCPKRSLGVRLEMRAMGERECVSSGLSPTSGDGAERPLCERDSGQWQSQSRVCFITTPFAPEEYLFFNRRGTEEPALQEGFPTEVTGVTQTEE
jgi:hypothetical protein